MKEKILSCLNRYPGARTHFIASEIQYFSIGVLLRTMYKMENNGLIRHIVITDPANKEIYNKWYLTEAGYRAIMNVD